jgi:hypothetical protein
MSIDQHTNTLRLEKSVQVRDDLVRTLERLLADAKSGELQGMAYVTCDRGGYWYWTWSGWISSCERLLGELRLLEEDVTRGAWDVRHKGV